MILYFETHKLEGFQQTKDHKHLFELLYRFTKNNSSILIVLYIILDSFRQENDGITLNILSHMVNCFFSFL